VAGYQDLARILWPAYAKRRVLFAGDELLVCEWHCHGEERPWDQLVQPHAELDLPRAGLHLRAPSARRRHVIDPATAGFAHAGDEYRRASPTAHPATSTLVAVRGALAESLVPRRCSRALAVTAVAARLHLRLARAVDPLEVEELALALVRCTLAPEAPHAMPVSPARRRLAEEVEHVIATRFADRLTLEVIARLCKTSPFHASRVFRAVTGETVHRRLTRVRLWNALFQLHRGGRPSQIALATGFSSHSHFTSAFRAELGIAPSSVQWNT
jgi:AraC family transcriptional regulator